MRVYLLLALAVVGCSADESAETTVQLPPALPEDTAAQVAAPSRAEMHETCKAMSEFAATIMSARQQGVSMSQMMESPPNTDAEIEKLGQALVIEAFERPRMSVPQNQREAVVDFESEVYLGCIKESPAQR